MKLRIPTWAGAKTRATVNQRAVEEVKPGQWLSLQRMWKNGDRIEIAFDMPLRLEAVDKEHPNRAALMRGPLALFALGESLPLMTPAELLAAQQQSSAADGWSVKTSTGAVRMVSFPSIAGETYRLYQHV